MRALKLKIVLALSIAATLLAVVCTYSTFSHTYDEPAHLATGLEMLDLGSYYYEHHHPPLARVAIALGPYLAGKRSARETAAPQADMWLRLAQGYDEGRRILYDGGQYDRVLTLARLGILPFLLIALLVTFAWCRDLLGDWPGVLAVVLLATTPPFLGNAGIATLDVPMAALCAASIYAFCRWLDRPVLVTAVALGVATGAAVMSKFSAIPFLGVAFIAIFVWRSFILICQRSPVIGSAHLKSSLVVAMLTLAVFWLSYGAGFTTLVDPTNRPYEMIDNLFGQGSTVSERVSDLVELPVVPKFVAEMWSGIEDLRYHNVVGHRSYLLGEVGSQGWWYYYLVAIAVKTPLPLLVAGLCGIPFLLRTSLRQGDWRIGAPALAFVAVLAFASMYSKINLGIRHVLVLYPLLAICATFFVVKLVRKIGRKNVAAWAVGLLIAAQVAVSSLAYPDFMAYFNIVAGSAPERVLIPIDLDWGQDIKRLETELRKRGVDHVAIAAYSSADLTKHDLPGYRRLVPHTPQTGWIAVSLWRKMRETDFNWLRAFEPVARIGKSIDLYHITDDAAVANLSPTIIELAPGVYMRDKKDLHGSNQVFVEFESFIVVFDPSTVIQARQLLDEIRRRTSKPIRYAIISHFHPDHSAGAAVFAAAGAELVAAEAARRDFDGWVRKDFASKILSQPADYAGLTYSPPTLFIRNSWVLDDGTQRLEVMHLGHGHTSGDLVGWMPKYRILFAGDLSTDGFLNLANANLSGWIAVLDKLKALNPAQIVMGHGHLAGPKALADSQRYLMDLRSNVTAMVAKGMSFREIVGWYANTPMPMHPELLDIELAFAEAGGVRESPALGITKRRVLWVGGWMGLLGIPVLVLWFRRRRANRDPRITR